MLIQIEADGPDIPRFQGALCPYKFSCIPRAPFARSSSAKSSSVCATIATVADGMGRCVSGNNGAGRPAEEYNSIAYGQWAPAS